MNFLQQFAAMHSRTAAPTKPVHTKPVHTKPVHTKPVPYTDWVFDAPRNVLFFDFETVYESSVSVKNMTWRDYVEAVKQQMDKTTVAYAVNDGAPVFTRDLDEFSELYQSCDCVVAHNLVFDARIARDVLGLAWPLRSFCTLELSHRAWPAQPGGYGLENLTHAMPELPCKLKIDLENCTDAELEAYNKRDVEGCQALYYECVERLSGAELCLAELSSRANGVQCTVDREAAQAAQLGFYRVANHDIKAALAALGCGVDPKTVFGLDGDCVKSIKYQALRRVLDTQLGFKTVTTSKKKLNPALLAAHKRASAVIDAVADIGTALSHARRVAKLGGRLDLNYRYSFAATGRPSGSGVGRGSWNALNIPKRDRRIASIIRPLYAFDGPVVCGDAANAEYRAVGLLTGCEHIVNLFRDNALADPYSEFCHTATGIRANKGDPLRDVVFKRAVLSLNFLCGLPKWIEQLLLAVAKGDTTLEGLSDIATRNRWHEPQNSGWYSHALQRTGCPGVVGAVAFHTYNLFHEVHPELRQFGKWAVATLEAYAASIDGDACLADRMKYPGAPDPKWCEFLPDRTKGDEKSIVVRCGLWSPTVNWRGLKVRRVKRFGVMEPCMSMYHERQGYRGIHPSLCIENCAQSFSRNQISELKLRMWKKHGFGLGFDIYDQAIFFTDEPRRCYESLMREVGPDSDGCGYGPYFVFNPNEIEYSTTMKGKEMPPEWWAAQTR